MNKKSNILTKILGTVLLLATVACTNDSLQSEVPTGNINFCIGMRPTFAATSTNDDTRATATAPGLPTQWEHGDLILVQATYFPGTNGTGTALASGTTLLRCTTAGDLVHNTLATWESVNNIDGITAGLVYPLVTHSVGITATYIGSSVTSDGTSLTIDDAIRTPMMQTVPFIVSGTPKTIDLSGRFHHLTFAVSASQEGTLSGTFKAYTSIDLTTGVFTATDVTSPINLDGSNKNAYLLPGNAGALDLTYTPIGGALTTYSITPQAGTWYQLLVTAGNETPEP